MRNTAIDKGALIKAAREYGTPCVCYEKSEILHWASLLSSALPGRARLVYSVKASPNPALLNIFRELGFFFETASEGELRTLLALRIPSERIWLSGQAKSENYIHYALAQGIDKFNLESLRELELLGSQLAKSGAGMDISCNLRVNPVCSASNSILASAGCPSAFGVDESQMEALLKSRFGALVNGIFVYAGSQIFQADDIVANCRLCLDLCEKFFGLTGRPLKNVDFGGGFGVPENDNTPELDLKHLESGLESLFQGFAEATCFTPETSFFFESGRYLSARAACLLTSIRDIKYSAGEKFVIIDAGINALGTKQKEYRLDPPYLTHLSIRRGAAEVYRVSGPTCTPIDLVHPGLPLVDPRIGDKIAIMDCGGYAAAFSPQNFNGLYRMPELLHDSGKLITLTRREEVETIFGAREYIPLGSGSEVGDAILLSCPRETDEIENIAMLAEIIRQRKRRPILYDVSSDGVESLILCKILSRYYKIFPEAVFSDCASLCAYLKNIPCLPLADFEKWVISTGKSDLFVLIAATKAEKASRKSAFALMKNMGLENCHRVRSELLESMELDFYSCIIRHAQNLQGICDRLADVLSKRNFIEYIRTILENDFWRLPQEILSAKYWGEDLETGQGLYAHLPDECWLNLGACEGDTIFRYLSHKYSFSKIFAVEQNRKALTRCKANLRMLNSQLLDRISFSDSRIGLGRNERNIDDLFGQGRLTLINMDIEGAEKAALLSGAKVIKRDRPVLAICIYHRPEDLHALPEAILELVPDYRLYLRKYPNYNYHRYNSKQELVLYAIPPERCLEEE